MGTRFKKEKAQALVKQYGQLVERWLPLAKCKRNPAGYIVKALEENWELHSYILAFKRKEMDELEEMRDRYGRP